MMKSTNSNSGFPILLNRKNILWLALTTMLLVVFSSNALEKKNTNSTKVEWLEFVQFKDPSRPTTRHPVTVDPFFWQLVPYFVL